MSDCRTISEVDGAPVRSFTYSHDALGRPVRRVDATPSVVTTNTFSYNARSEVVSSTLGGVAATYAYDPAGNRTTSSSGASPSSYDANALNQYESVATGGATNALVHDAYGNLSRTAHHTCYFVDDNLLEVVYTNRTRFGHRCAFFTYDALGRRASKSSTPYGGHDWTHRYCHSGWLLLLEEVKKGAGIPFEPVHYVWGRDLSGTLDGAGGVGGLLATEVGGVWYFPLYDANGNVTDYVSETGEVVASYAYDAFGRTIAQSGPMADVFPFRFSTKYYDSETGLYYYGRRYYSPDLGRWLNRDPIEEEGGVNLYAFCDNCPLLDVDPYGLSTFVLIYDSIDPMFKAWAEDSYHRILSGSTTRYGSSSVKYDPEKDTIAMVPITGIGTIDGLSQYKDVKYLASFGHGAEGKIWWGYRDGDEISKSVVTGINGFKLNVPELATKVPFSRLLLDFDQCGFIVEFYHCSSAHTFMVDKNDLMVFSNPESFLQTPTTPSPLGSASVISIFKKMVERKYPKTKFSIVGSEEGVSNGRPWDRGWPRPIGYAKRIKVTP